jgi:hypothetical protein
MTALLGLLAVAGYQNRDKFIKMLGDLGKPGAAGQDGIGGGHLRSSLGGDSAEGILWARRARRSLQAESRAKPLQTNGASLSEWGLILNEET